MACAEVPGKKFMQVTIGASGDAYAMVNEAVVRSVSVTGLTGTDKIILQEQAGSMPKLFTFDVTHSFYQLQGIIQTCKLGWQSADCVVTTPANVIVAFELD
jgi:hypothetical protein